MDEDDRKNFMEAINEMIKAFEKTLEQKHYVLPLLKIEVRELRHGDFSLGESIIVDQINEHLEDKKIKRKDVE